MPLDLARRVGVALDIRSNTRIRQIDRALKEYVRLTPQSPTVPSAGNIDASQIISGFVPDARISESSVTQHEAALLIDWMQLDNVPATFPPSAHNHAASDINSGTFADARIAQSNVTQHEAALDIDWMQLTGVPSTFTPADHITESTWTPGDFSGEGLTLTHVSTYSKHENLVIARTKITFPVAVGGPNLFNGLPFTVQNSDAAEQAFVTWSDEVTLRYVKPVKNTSTFRLYDATGALINNAVLSGKQFHLTIIYRT
jgi:hypothetical protein